MALQARVDSAIETHKHQCAVLRQRLPIWRRCVARSAILRYRLDELLSCSARLRLCRALEAQVVLDNMSVLVDVPRLVAVLRVEIM
jgi:hypothetical protein